MLTGQMRDYVSHSQTSDPGALSWMLDDLPVGIGELIDATGGLLMHPHTAYDLFGELESSDHGAGELTMARMLRRLVELDPAPLSQARPPGRRLRVNCGRYAMFFLMVLRHHGVPARKRVGFNWDGWIHEIVQYWDSRREQWIFIDPNPVSREPMRDFVAGLRQLAGGGTDGELIRPGEAFTPGSLAWRLCRAGRADARCYKVSEHDGMSSVRIALLQDLDSMDKVELRTFDEWHPLITSPMHLLDEAALNWLDAAAGIIEDGETEMGRLDAFYADSPYGSAVRSRLNELVSAT